MLIEKEEKTVRGLTYDDLCRWLILALLIVLGIFAVYTLKRVLLLVAVVFIVGMVFNPVIAWLERRGLRRGLALLVLVLTVFVVVGLIVWLLLPPFVDQVQQLIQQVPEYSTRIYNQAKGWLRLTRLYKNTTTRSPTICSVRRFRKPAALPSCYCVQPWARSVD